MDVQVSALGAIGALVIAIILILKKVSPAYGMIAGALIGGLVGGIIGALVMGRGKNINTYTALGLGKMTGVAIMLLGTGTLAGIIANSGLKDVLIDGLTILGLPGYALAPVSGYFYVSCNSIHNCRYCRSQSGI